jgi:RNA polymerase sigma-70 factor, ECF subfamily
MLGSVADAEDMVQEAFLRRLDADREAVREPEAYLRRVVTRLCLDHLKSARRWRETYIGPWLPEPIVEAALEIEAGRIVAIYVVRNPVKLRHLDNHAVH